MIRLRTDRLSRAVVTLLIVSVWLSPAIEARQVSPPAPPGGGSVQNCEAERDRQYQKAWAEYQDALAVIDLRKKAASEKCKNAFNNVDIPDCTRKANDAVKLLGASLSAGYLGCAVLCAVVVTPAGVVIAPQCAQCLITLSVGTATGLIGIEISRASCIAKAQDVANNCRSDAEAQAKLAGDEAFVAYKAKCRTADLDLEACRAKVGG